MQMCYLLGSSISFRQSNYIINENVGSVQVEVVLSDPVSFDFTVLINHHDISATGMNTYCILFHTSI